MDMSIAIRIFDTPSDAGIYVAALAESVIVGNQAPVLGLATGETPIPFYKALVRLYECGLDLSHVVTINLDEYVGLGADHPQSYRHFMDKYLFSKTNLSPDRTVIPDGVASNLLDECKRYDDILNNYPIDIQILGIGMNGHIGFNEPSDILLARTHVVDLQQETIKSNARFFDSIEQVPSRAITMGIQSILQAKRIILMAFGKEKSTIIEQVVTGNVSTSIPASIVQLHQDVIIVLDRDSASNILENSIFSVIKRLKTKKEM